MTRVYFVRHAQPDFKHANDAARPLTEEGMSDTKLVEELLGDKKIDVFYSSPYKRSFDTVKGTAERYGIEIITDDRFRERDKGAGSNNREMFQRRWADHNFREEDGESIAMVRERNIAALKEILDKHSGENIVIGTHGTALSSIINYYDPNFGIDGFMRIIDFMPYILEMDFDGQELISKTELGYIEKKFQGKG